MATDNPQQHRVANMVCINQTVMGKSEIESQSQYESQIFPFESLS